ncbi:MAG: hypothetical protein IJB15_05895 [Clostridia bacterium]|nr:hypothetical protein [Clostridia bacterium]
MMWADEDTIRRLIREGVFVPYTYLDELFAHCRIQKDPVENTPFIP